MPANTYADRVRPHTPPRVQQTALVGAALALMTCVAPARAEWRDLPARVVWTRSGFVYVASPDSGVLSPGMGLRFVRGNRERAGGTVLSLLDPWLALARLESGALAGEKRLDRLRVRGMDPIAKRVGSLRLGLPGRKRVNLLFACARTGVNTRFADANYDVDSLAGGALRLRRVADGFPASGAPDTLHVRFFSDAADQEIALERGELDVAVFWPGEGSTRLRSDAPRRHTARGLRSRGVVACVTTAPDTARVSGVALSVMNREAFSGDLLPWGELEPVAAPGEAGRFASFHPDPALPGARLLERVLARATGGAAARTVRLAYLDVAIAGRDAVQASWRTRHVQPVFALRCPVLVAPDLRAAVARMGGADAFANLLRCEGRAP